MILIYQYIKRIDKLCVVNIPVFVQYIKQ